MYYINFNEIKADFIIWLQDRDINSGKDVLPDKYEDIKISSHLSDFKDYLVENNIADSSIFTKSFKEIKEMQFSQGKLVEVTEDENKDNVIISGILNEIFNDEDIISALDEDQSKDLDIGEIEHFVEPYLQGEGEDAILAFDDLEEPINNIYLLEEIYNDTDAIKILDEDNDDEISDLEKAKFQAFLKKDNDKLKSEDIEAVYNSIKDGSFDIEEYKNFKFESDSEITNKTENKDKATEQPNDTPTTQQVPTNTTSNPANYVADTPTYDQQNTNPTGGTDKTPEATDSLEGMTISELEDKKTEKQNELDTTNNKIRNVHSGNDQDIAKKQEDVNGKKEAYLKLLEEGENISSETKEQEKKLIENISATQKEIDSMNTSLTGLKALVATQNTAIEIDEHKVSVLKSALESLPENPGDSDSKDIEDKRAELTSKLKAAEEQLKKDKEPLEERNSEGRTPEEEISYLETELPKLNSQLKDYQEQKKLIEMGDGTEGNKGILAGCSEKTKEALEAYNNAQNSLEEDKNNKIKGLEETKNNLEKEINQIKEKIKEKYKVTPELFTNDNTIVDYITADESPIPYLLLQPENVNPDEELPLIVFLHGGGEVSDETNAESIMRSIHGPGGIMTEEAGWDLGNFNGYVICPHSNNTDWASHYKEICQAIEEFQKTHKTGKVVLMGASMGGSGVVSIAQTDCRNAKNGGNRHFDEAVVISGYNGDLSGIDIPISGYVGESDDPTSIKIMKSIFGSKLNYVPSNHERVVQVLLTRDDNKDGISDILKKLFSKKS